MIGRKAIRAFARIQTCMTHGKDEQSRNRSRAAKRLLVNFSPTAKHFDKLERELLDRLKSLEAHKA
jgi:hypothetical protein